MPSVVHVVGVVYTPSCTKGKEVNNFFNSQFQFICCCNHTSHIKCSHIQCIHAHMYYYLQYAYNLSLSLSCFILMLGLLIANCTYPVAVTGLQLIDGKFIFTLPPILPFIFTLSPSSSLPPSLPPSDPSDLSFPLIPPSDPSLPPIPPSLQLVNLYLLSLYIYSLSLSLSLPPILPPSL